MGLSLPIDGLEDHLLKIQDLPNITYGDWQRGPKGTKENPIVIEDASLETTIEVDAEDGFLYTAQEMEEGVVIKEEDENEVTTDSSVESEERFDADEEDYSSFDDAIDGDEDMDDENM
jgi:hypothetical protein